MGERLLQLLSLIDDDLLEEAIPTASPAVRRQKPRPRTSALAACLALLCGLSVVWFSLHGWRAGSSGPGEDTGSDVSVENEFSAYAGPILPLTLAEDAPALTAARMLTLDFSPTVSADSPQPRQWGASVQDAYTLTNAAGEDSTVTLCYPFTGTLQDTALPNAAVNDAPAEGTLLASASTVNGAECWEDYQSLLSNGSALQQARSPVSLPELSVTVYEFTDFAAPASAPAATQAISFSTKNKNTTILTYGFEGMSYDPETGARQYSYFVPTQERRCTQPKLLIVLGDDLQDYTLEGYRDGGCDPGTELDGVRCTVTRQETTLRQVLDQLCRCLGDEAHLTQERLDLFRQVLDAELLQSGLLDRADTDGYEDGRLDDVLREILNRRRILYLALPITVPSGGSVQVSFDFWLAPSYNYGAQKSSVSVLQGYDLATTLASSLSTPVQSLRLTHTDGIRIVRQNLGLDPDSGVTEAALDPDQAQYYLVLRPSGES